MINVEIGNVLEQTHAILVHGCNTEGVMGAGIALGIRTKFPEAYKVYRDEYEKRLDPDWDGEPRLDLGSVTTVHTKTDLIIVNGVTQTLSGKGRQVSYDAIQTVFEKVNDMLFTIEYSEGEEGEPYKLIFPAIGAGLGRGDWRIIEAIIDSTIDPCFSKSLFLLKPETFYFLKTTGRDR